MLICELLKGLPDEVVKVLTQDLATLRYFAEACGHEADLRAAQKECPK